VSRHRLFGLLLGRVTSEQLFLACLLGGIVGFVPWDHSGAVLLALCLGALLTLNASVPVFTTIAGAGSLIALAAHEQVDRVGSAVANGPLSGLLSRLAEAPLLAWAEWESNRLTGGAALGLLLGALSGVLLVQLVTRLRTRLAALEEGSEAFRAWTGRVWVRALAWLLLGGLPKEGFRATLELKGRWWRPAGLLALAGLLIGASIYLSLAQAKGIRGALVGSLAQVTGAQVDCREATLSFAAAKISVGGLAIADPEDLSRDLVRWESLEADLDAVALARHELVIERLVLTGATFDEPREEVAARIELPPLPTGERSKPGKGKVLDWRELVEDKERIEELLEQVRRSFELLGGEGSDKEAERSAQEAAGIFLPPPAARTPLVRTRPRIHIIEAAWREIPLSDGRTVDLVLSDLSDEPDLVERAMTTTARTSDGDLEFIWSRESRDSWRFKGGGSQVDAVRLAKDLGIEDKLVAGVLGVGIEGVVSSPGARLSGEVQLQIKEGRADIGSGVVSLPTDAVKLRLEGSLNAPDLVDRDGAWRRWLTSAARGVLLEKAAEGGLRDLLRGLKKD
jgi:hypothetical protein